MLLYTKRYQTAEATSSLSFPASGVTKPSVNESASRHSSPGSQSGSPPSKPAKGVGEFNARGITIAGVYDSSVEDVAAKTKYREWQIHYFASLDYSGTVLDLACGTGIVGTLIHNAGSKTAIHGVDVSPLSLQTDQVKEHYAHTTVGLIQEVIMSMSEFDHIVRFGALHFLNRMEFNVTLSRILTLARKSIAFDVDDVRRSAMTPSWLILERV